MLFSFEISILTNKIYLLSSQVNSTVSAQLVFKGSDVKVQLSVARHNLVNTVDVSQTKKEVIMNKFWSANVIKATKENVAIKMSILATVILASTGNAPLIRITMMEQFHRILHALATKDLKETSAIQM